MDVLWLLPGLLFVIGLIGFPLIVIYESKPGRKCLEAEIGVIKGVVTKVSYYANT